MKTPKLILNAAEELGGTIKRYPVKFCGQTIGYAFEVHTTSKGGGYGEVLIQYQKESGQKGWRIRTVGKMFWVNHLTQAREAHKEVREGDCLFLIKL